MIRKAGGFSYHLSLITYHSLLVFVLVLVVLVIFVEVFFGDVEFDGVESDDLQLG